MTLFFSIRNDKIKKNYKSWWEKGKVNQSAVPVSVVLYQGGGVWYGTFINDWLSIVIKPSEYQLFHWCGRISHSTGHLIKQMPASHNFYDEFIKEKLEDKKFCTARFVDCKCHL